MNFQLKIIFTFLFICKQSLAWELHQKSVSGDRSQFLIDNGDGNYKYGYQTGFVPVESIKFSNFNANNRDFIEGEIVMKNNGIHNVINDKAQNIPEKESDNKYQSRQLVVPTNPENVAVNILNTDGSYAFSYVNDHSFRQESADAGNNVQGKYVYKDTDGIHDLTYVAGAHTGFLATKGSLAKANGLKSAGNPVVFYTVPFGSPDSRDGSYSFEYSAPFHSRQEIGDSKGNVYGRYSFTNEQGSHDLLYVAGSKTGFLPVGGSLLNSQSSSIVKKSDTDESTEQSFLRKVADKLSDLKNKRPLVETSSELNRSRINKEAVTTNKTKTSDDQQRNSLYQYIMNNPSNQNSTNQKDFNKNNFLPRPQEASQNNNYFRSNLMNKISNSWTGAESLVIIPSCFTTPLENRKQFEYIFVTHHPRR